MRHFTRRGFLRGATGAVVGLPLLEGLPSKVWAAPEPAGGYAAFIVHTFGVQQAGFGNDGEGFWPRTPGRLTAELFAENADRALSELADQRDRLLFVRGVKFPFAPTGDLHVCGANQVLTASRSSNDGRTAMSESVDNHIGRRFGREPIALYAGSRVNNIKDCVFFRGPRDLRVGENNPFAAYTRMMGAAPGAAQGTEELAARTLRRRKSVNDLVREELRELLAHTSLSAEDRRRMDQHLSSVRDLELTLTRGLAEPKLADLRSVNESYGTSAARLKVERLHMDLAVFALASGLTRAVAIQMGNGHEDMTYTVGGSVLARAHLISHRAANDFAVTNNSTPDGARQHHEIDRINARQFKYLLDQMGAQATPRGSLLDLGYAVWTNFIATGNHNYHNVPYIIGGRGGGFLKTGQYLNVSGNLGRDSAGNVPNNKLLNVLVNAAGLRKPDGALVDDFGDSSLPRGLISEMIAA